MHCVKYINGKDAEMKYHVRQNYSIGEGKVFSVGEEPISVRDKVTITFRQGYLSVGKAASVKLKSDEIVYCSEPMCVKSFLSVDLMIKHLDFGKHEFQPTNSSTMSKVRDQWVKRFIAHGGLKALPGCSSSSNPVSPSNNQTHGSALEMGWALLKRIFQR